MIGKSACAASSLVKNQDSARCRGKELDRFKGGVGEAGGGGRDIGDVNGTIGAPIPTVAGTFVANGGREIPMGWEACGVVDEDTGVAPDTAWAPGAVSDAFVTEALRWGICIFNRLSSSSVALGGTNVCACNALDFGGTGGMAGCWDIVAGESVPVLPIPVPIPAPVPMVVTDGGKACGAGALGGIPDSVPGVVVTNVCGVEAMDGTEGVLLSVLPLLSLVKFPIFCLTTDAADAICECVRASVRDAFCNSEGLVFCPSLVCSPCIAAATGVADGVVVDVVQGPVRGVPNNVGLIMVRDTASEESGGMMGVASTAVDVVGLFNNGVFAFGYNDNERIRRVMAANEEPGADDVSVSGVAEAEGLDGPIWDWEVCEWPVAFTAAIGPSGESSMMPSRS